MKNEKGQTLLEFLLLLAILIGIAHFMTRTFHSKLGKDWKEMIKLIADPTDSPIELR